ncbi:type II secretion system F family protein [Corynebacterium callunae]|uniref:type II secretion system F family protein n=1 Tax=Corynebacterium callunae TaxID=1721 RepID=UPI003981F0FA
MVLPLMLLALAALCSPSGVLARGPKNRSLNQHLQRRPPWLIVGIFPLATTIFVIIGVDAATVVALLMVISAMAWRLNTQQKEKIARKQAAALAGFLGLCAGNLRAGAPMVEAMDHALANTPANIPGEKTLNAVLSSAARRARSGGGGHAVLAEAEHPDLKRLGTLWQTSEKHGIPLVTLIEQMRLRLDTRERHRAATRAALQGPQATAVILSLLPVAGVIMGTAMGADPLAILSGGGIGGIMLVVGVGLGVAGFVITQKILENASPS